MTLIPELTFQQPITLRSRQQAQQFAARHARPDKARQVYLNTLAVQSVADYLHYFGFKANLAASPSWQPVCQALADTAALHATGWGVLECRPVLPGATTLSIPPEVWDEGAACVAVQFDRALRQAKLLGFVRESSAGEIPLNELQATAVLLDDLSRTRLVRLTAWLQGNVTAGWQQLQDLAPLGLEPAFNFRSGAIAPHPDGNLPPAKPRCVQRGKVLHLRRADAALALVVGIAPTASGSYDANIALYPLPPAQNLPADLNIQVLDTEHQVVMQASARGTPAASLEFSGEAGEDFSVRLELGEVVATETFTI